MDKLIQFEKKSQKKIVNMSDSQGLNFLIAIHK